MSSLTPTARVILGMLKLGVATGYDIKKVIDFSTRFFWTASYGQIYPELKRLRKAGLVRAEQVPRGKVKRTVYSLTPKGERALHDWLTDNQEVLFEIRDESLLRLFFSDQLSRDEVIANLRMQEQIFGLVLERFRELEVDVKEGVAEGRVYPYVALQYGLEFMTFARDWYAEKARRLEAGEKLVELEDDEAARGEARLGPAG
jgi:PadR family transcriptional regulator, regulatory protein AphA